MGRKHNRHIIDIDQDDFAWVPSEDEEQSRDSGLGDTGHRLLMRTDQDGDIETYEDDDEDCDGYGDENGDKNGDDDEDSRVRSSNITDDLELY